MSSSQAITVKIAYLGGGSRGWARHLMQDLALCPDLQGEVWLYDINKQAAEANVALSEWIMAQPGVRSSWRYRAVDTMEEALQGADFVVCSVQPGPLEAMEADLSIPARYGRIYPVGDTTGAPGLVRGLRAVLAYESFAQQIMQHCPDAWVINYSNPMTICTRTLFAVAPTIKAFGCCHEVFGTQELLAELAAQYLDVPQPPRQEIKVNVMGINHFTWIDAGTWQGHDLLALLKQHIAQPGVLRDYSRVEVESWGSYFRCAHQVKYRLFQRYGVLGAAGDRHLAEFAPGFLGDEETAYRYGFSLTPISYRYARWEEAPAKTAALMAGETSFELGTSGEEGVQQMLALLGRGDLMTNVNRPNTGQLPELPMGAVVETNAYFRQHEVRPLGAGPMPDGLVNLIAPHVRNQELIVRAGLERDLELAFQAVYSDPLTNLPVDQAWAMFSEMIEATKTWLPGF